MTVREAEIADALAIARVQVAAWQAAYRHLLPQAWLGAMSVQDRSDKWQQIIGEGRSTVAVACHAGDVIGFASSGPSRDKDALPHTHELFALYVHPGHWSGGQGWRLWQSVRQSALKLAATRCTLWAMVGNERAVRFYERAGFTLEPGSRQNFELAGVALQEDRYVQLVGDNGALC